VPLLLETTDETARAKLIDALIVVSAPEPVQRARVLERPNMSEEKLDAILARQVPDANKRQAADFIIETGHPSLAPARAQLAACMQKLSAKHQKAYLAWRDGPAKSRVPVVSMPQAPARQGAAAPCPLVVLPPAPPPPKEQKFKPRYPGAKPRYPSAASPQQMRTSEAAPPPPMTAGAGSSSAAQQQRRRQQQPPEKRWPSARPFAVTSGAGWNIRADASGQPGSALVKRVMDDTPVNMIGECGDFWILADGSGYALKSFSGVKWRELSPAEAEKLQQPATGTRRPSPSRPSGSLTAASAALASSPRPDGWSAVVAVSFDLDDTLWPTLPPIVAAGEALAESLKEELPKVAESGYAEREKLRESMRELMGREPLLAHDYTEMRRVSLLQAAELLNESGGLAEQPPPRAPPRYPGQPMTEAHLRVQKILEEQKRRRAEARERAVGRVIDTFVRARSDVESHLFEDVAPSLAALRDAGLRVGSLTNGNADVRLHPNISKLFGFAANAAEAGASKPHPAPFWHAAHAAGCKPAELVHIGDDVTTDLIGALGAGCRAILLTRKYRADGSRTTEEMAYMIGKRAAMPPSDPTRWREVQTLAEAVEVVLEWRGDDLAEKEGLGWARGWAQDGFA
jgi:HAD superfamily hydrolase (TIGR01549 family)